MSRDSEIVSEFTGGRPKEELAARFGLTHRRINQILLAAGIRKPSQSLSEIIANAIEVQDTGYASPCWLWRGRTNHDGYGLLWHNGKHCRAHRISYEMQCGQIPRGLVLDHLCRARNCINPSHLEAVTDRENVRRGLVADLTVKRVPITHCPAGHEYTPENSYFCRRGTRSCVTCRRARSKTHGASGRTLARAGNAGRGGAAL